MVTIFSAANTMIGSGLVSLPWAFQQSGAMLSVILCLIAVLISYYTCNLIIKCAKHDEDYQKTIYKYLGKSGWMLGLITTTMLIFGAGTVIFVI
jgi:amino acid permease